MALFDQVSNDFLKNHIKMIEEMWKYIGEHYQHQIG